MHIRRLLIAAAVAAALATPALAQAPPNAASARVRYNSLKNTAKPEGELKARIDAIDQEIAAATRLGQTAQVRRLIAKATALLNKRAWTDVDDFDQSLVLRSDRLFIDSSKPYLVRLEQAYAPAIELTTPLIARATARPLMAQPAATGAAAGEIQPLGMLEDVPRDLRDAPLTMELNLSAVPDGSYSIDVELLDEVRVLGTVSLRVALQKGLDARLAALETLSASAPAAVQPDIRYPADYVRKVNRGVIEMGTFDLSRELTAAGAIAAASKGGKDPFNGKAGGFERHYVLEGANEIMPYRVFVPKSYTGAQPAPLVIALHGLGANEDSFMDSYGGRVPQLAEKHGFLLATPLGYRVDGFYGYSYGNDGAARRRQELSEKDVMQVLARMRRDYKVDDTRIYLMGHSMGAIGTWFLGAKYPEIWAALGPVAGLGNPQSVALMKHIPQFVVHGDADPTVNVSGSRTMVAEMKKLGIDHTYVEVPGGNHTDIAMPNFPAMFEFFASKRRTSVTTQQQ
ncbi:MAG: PHB depolymerase family esterase [Acidobacteriota bacterium]